MNAFTISAFRNTYPEFTSTDKYPDTIITNWATIATSLVNCRAWKNSTLLGIQLYVAHEITLQAQSISSAQIGGTPGQQSGQINQKTVGSVTAAYDSVSAAEKDAGHWNLTTYGKQFIRLARIFGAGTIQL